MTTTNAIDLNQSTGFITTLVDTLTGLGISGTVVGSLLILVIVIGVISFTWNKGLGSFLKWVSSISFKSFKEKRNKNAKLESELTDFLVREKDGRNEGLLKLESKIDEKIELMSQDIKDLKISLDKTMNDVETYSLSKNTLKKIYSNEALKRAELAQIDLIDMLYVMIEDKLIIELDNDQESNKEIVYQVLNNIKRDYIQISEKSYRHAEINLNIQGLISDANEPTYNRMNDFYDQLADIVENTKNGSRKKIIKKHLEMCKYVERDFFSKEFWRLAKQKFEL